MSSALSDGEKLEQANALKDKGNSQFASGKHAEAIESFTGALELDPKNHILYSNRSAAYTALGKKDPSVLPLAVADGAKCVELAPDFGKGYSRHGTALFMLKRYDEAVRVYARRTRQRSLEQTPRRRPATGAEAVGG